MDDIPVRRALLSVSDKTGLVEFASGLRAHGVEIISTGGTAKVLRDAGLSILEIEAFTGFPEILDGRVKTLHPRVHAGILFRRDDPSHLKAMKEHQLGSIDLVSVNLYPFEATVARQGVTREEAVEQIDIGGPSMIRSAAKNHEHVTVVSSPDQYGAVLSEMRAHGGATTLPLRKRLALEAFRRTALYDAAISGFFESQERSPSDRLPDRFQVSLPAALKLRYGENPHQAAVLYGSFLDHFRKLHGRDLSYNNILDLSSAQEMAEFLARRGPAVVVIVKHSNPCGVAVGATMAEAWRKALATDPQSASGGIVASSREVDLEAAEAFGDHFLEILLAPGFDPKGLELLQKKKNRILLEVVRPLSAGESLSFRSVPGGALAQTADVQPSEEKQMRVVTKREPTKAEMGALLFGWDVARFVKSNAIVYAAGDRTLGIGAGQMSRVDAARLGAMKARDAGLDLKGSAVASDAFFPFPDGILVAADAGATAIIQPGGSVRDEEIIDAANSRGMAMVFTGIRHFRH
jgi:phosphoribosylaminoimidazolecarboxamide formyltransferase/IMP cyclohydrolase